MNNFKNIQKAINSYRGVETYKITVYFGYSLLAEDLFNTLDSIVFELYGINIVNLKLLKNDEIPADEYEYLVDFSGEIRKSTLQMLSEYNYHAPTEVTLLNTGRVKLTKALTERSTKGYKLYVQCHDARSQLHLIAEYSNIMQKWATYKGEVACVYEYDKENRQYIIRFKMHNALDAEDVLLVDRIYDYYQNGEQDT